MRKISDASNTRSSWTIPLMPCHVHAGIPTCASPLCACRIFNDGGRAVATFIQKALSYHLGNHVSSVSRLRAHSVDGRETSAASSQHAHHTPGSDIASTSRGMLSSAMQSCPSGGCGTSSSVPKPIVTLGEGAVTKRRRTGPVSNLGQARRTRPFAPKRAGVWQSADAGRVQLSEGGTAMGEGAGGGLFDPIEALEDAADEVSATRDALVPHDSTDASLQTPRVLMAALAASDETVISRASLSALRVIAQVDRKFIIASSGRMLFAIDQHAADERVQLERLMRATIDLHGAPVDGGVKLRRLSPSMRLTPTVHEHSLLKQYISHLRRWGWELDVGGTYGTVCLSAVPVVQSVELAEHAMLEYADKLDQTGGGSSMGPPAVLRVLASKACRRAAMFGDTLSPPQCQAILSELSQCDLPFQCAHGRPTMAPLLDLNSLDGLNL